MSLENRIYVYLVDDKAIESNSCEHPRSKACEYAQLINFPKRAIVRFDSKTEYDFYLMLKSLEKKEEIANLEIHPTFRLLPAYRSFNGVYHGKLDYTADFAFYDIKQKKMRIIDVKDSYISITFAFKWRLFDYFYRDKFSIEVSQLLDRRYSHLSFSNRKFSKSISELQGD
jgi:hypothetical protein